MDVITPIGADAEAKLIIQKSNAAEALFALCIPVFVNDGGFEIEPHSVGKIQSMLGEIGPTLRLVPTHHLI